MGFFDFLKGKSKDEMSPVKATTISLLYLMYSDGESDTEELGSLLAILGGKSVRGTVHVGGQSQEFMDSCVAYIKANKVEQFLKEASDKLSDSQKLYIITNMIDMSLSDGEAEIQEQEMIALFMKEFAIDSDRVMPIYQVLEFKNDRKIFQETDYEKNNTSYQFRVKG